MTDFELNIEKLLIYYNEIKLKYKDKIEDFDNFFISKITTTKNNIDTISTLFSDGKIFETQVYESNDKRRMIIFNTCFDQKTNSYKNLLPDGPKSDYAVLQNFSESYSFSEFYDDNGNRTENIDDRLYLTYNSDDELVCSKQLDDNTQKWIITHYRYEDDMSKILIADADNNLKNLIICHNIEGEEVERFMYDSNLELMLRTKNETDKNGFETTTCYLPDGKMAWSFGDKFAYDKDNKLIYQVFETVEDELGSIKLVLYHSKFRKMWDDRLKKDRILTFLELLNISCFGENMKLWIDPHPEF
jgi:hypothetical protein